MSAFLTAHAASLPSAVPFVGAETQERARKRPYLARLGANESGFGPSARAISAMGDAARDEVWMYADPESYDLRQALAAHIGARAENIVIGAGIDGLLGQLCRLTLDIGTPVITSDGAYPTFAYHVNGYGGQLIRVPYRGDFEDPEALLTAARHHRAKIIYLANPDNPMGSYHSGAVIENMIAQLPPQTLLILDEAYSEMAPKDALPSIAPGHPQVIRLRTFSKAYGLAGGRVGYGIAAPDLVQAFDKIRDHFGMGRVSLIGALAALKDQEWLSHVTAQCRHAHARICAIAAQNNLHALPSATNFTAIDLGRDGDFARRVLSACLERGLFIRMPGVAPLDRCIRISHGTDAALDILEEILPQALKL